jgi:hypothetical protein
MHFHHLGHRVAVERCRQRCQIPRMPRASNASIRGEHLRHSALVDGATLGNGALVNGTTLLQSALVDRTAGNGALVDGTTLLESALVDRTALESALVDRAAGEGEGVVGEHVEGCLVEKLVTWRRC